MAADDARHGEPTDATDGEEEGEDIDLCAACAGEFAGAEAGEGFGFEFCAACFACLWIE